jgi:CheY-like chemotaxis protein
MDQSQITPKILVVDDNSENRALARATLEDEGYHVIVAATGEEGIRAFEAEGPDCVLLDIRMPGMDGFAVCSRIRALPAGADTPVVFLTALRDVGLTRRIAVGHEIYGHGLLPVLAAPDRSGAMRETFFSWGKNDRGVWTNSSHGCCPDDGRPPLLDV